VRPFGASEEWFLGDLEMVLSIFLDMAMDQYLLIPFLVG